MKIVDRKTFLALPAETLFAKYQPCVFEALAIKGDTIGEDDFSYQSIADAIDNQGSDDFFGKLDRAEATGESLPINLDCEGPDGCFEQDQLFAVWEPADVAALIARLSRCVSQTPA